jgi:RNA polymerase sigma factor (sigma-70 family)
VTDTELLNELRRGAASAMEMMVFRYHGPIYAYLYRMLNSKQLAEDFTQECFLRAMESIRKKRLPELLRPWLYRIAANLCRDHWRRSSTRGELLQDPAEAEYPADESVASIFDLQEERERVVEAVQRLSPEKRNVIVLRFYQELKLDEIAGILDIPLSTVKSRLYHSLGELQRLLVDETPGEGGGEGDGMAVTARRKVTKGGRY